MKTYTLYDPVSDEIKEMTRGEIAELFEQRKTMNLFEESDLNEIEKLLLDLNEKELCDALNNFCCFFPGGYYFDGKSVASFGYMGDSRSLSAHHLLCDQIKKGYVELPDDVGSYAMDIYRHGEWKIAVIELYVFLRRQGYSHRELRE